MSSFIEGLFVVYNGIRKLSELELRKLIGRLDLTPIQKANLLENAKRINTHTGSYNELFQARTICYGARIQPTKSTTGDESGW
jgi:hypothetical protein